MPSFLKIKLFKKVSFKWIFVCLILLIVFFDFFYTKRISNFYISTKQFVGIIADDLNTLANRFHYGDDKILEDLDKAGFYYGVSAFLGSKAACYNLGSIHEDNDIIKAIDYYERSAKKGYVKAMFRLGQIYHRGHENVPKDIMKAFDYYEQAAAAGHAEAMHSLGFIYHNGDEGIPKDIKMAISYYQQAVSHGHANSLLNIANIYHYGDENFPVNLYKAVDSYTRLFEERYNLWLPESLAKYKVELELQNIYKNGDREIRNYIRDKYEGYNLFLEFRWFLNRIGE